MINALNGWWHRGGFDLGCYCESTPVLSKRFIYDTPYSSFNCGSSLHYSSGFHSMGHIVEIDIKLNKNHDKNTISYIE